MVASHAKISTIDIAYRESGVRSGLPIVFVHANSSSSRAFASQLTGALSHAHRVVALDLPGHGASARIDDYSLQRFAEVLNAFEEALDLGGAVWVGHSLGGHLLLQAWAQLHARALVILGTPPLTRPPRFGAAFRPHPAGDVFLRAEITDDEIEIWRSGCFATTVEFPFAQLVRSADPRVRSSLHDALTSLDYRDETAVIREMSTPLAILHGELDALVDQSYLAALAAPTAWKRHVQLLPGVGHYAQVEGPAAFDDLLLAFVREL